MLLILELIKYESMLRLLPGLAFTLGAFAKSTSLLKRVSYCDIQSIHLES